MSVTTGRCKARTKRRLWPNMAKNSSNCGVVALMFRLRQLMMLTRIARQKMRDMPFQAQQHQKQNVQRMSLLACCRTGMKQSFLIQRRESACLQLLTETLCAHWLSILMEFRMRTLQEQTFQPVFRCITNQMKTISQLLKAENTWIQKQQKLLWLRLRLRGRSNSCVFVGVIANDYIPSNLTRTSKEQGHSDMCSRLCTKASNNSLCICTVAFKNNW
ncbi:hypothetical protein FGO68_gene11674 [Halteria grandinella]|uniref:Uncharacterized protein n=1 Tax=Halteria grandinella TaxID=5974 RepID=A0A8J8N966_HALGN|nr:hypothetical protein FGO68_gene11674 [Halteria grandinella]